jgi:protein-disulfide isomerase
LESNGNALGFANMDRKASMSPEGVIETPAQSEQGSHVPRGKAARSAIDLVASLAMIVAAGVIVWTAVRQQPTPATPSREIPVPAMPISVDGAPSLGDVRAPVVVVEFSDFQCPFCARFVRDILPELKKKYIDSGSVRLVFKNLPLTAVHHRAEAAAEAAVCAAEQGQFWPMHDAFFAEQGKLEDSDIDRVAASTGVRIETFRTCIQTIGANGVREDTELAATLKLASTPAFLIGRLAPGGAVAIRRTIAGARPLSDFAKAIDDVRASR